MAITGVLRSAMAQIRVMDLEESVKFYTEIVGLNEVCRTDDGRVCLKTYDEFDHHSLTLREAGSGGLDFLGFKVENDELLGEYALATTAFGLECEFIPANSDQPGYGRRLAVQLPNKHRIDLYADVEISEPHPQLKNPHIWEERPRGIGARFFDHSLLFGPNSGETVRYFMEVLGFAKVEIVKTPDGSGVLATWLTVNTRMHDVAILEAPDAPGKLHHIAFSLRDWSEIGNAADFLSVNNVVIDAGPHRHGVTRGQTIYFYDPTGNRIETFAADFAYFPDMPTREWDFSDLPRGINYYDHDNKIKDSFLTVVT
jgi:catechol 2,3-dioxygenase